MDPANQWNPKAWELHGFRYEINSGMLHPDGESVNDPRGGSSSRLSIDC